MFSESGVILFQLGMVMLLAFLGAFIASKLNQSVIIGYILAGILIGPHIVLNFWKINYTGLVHDTVFIDELSHIGLVLLLFFVGLDFSISKLKKTKTPATLLAIINLGFNMICGFLIGTILGWPLIDTLFLTGVVAMSSASITAKTLMELERLANPETEFLLGMVIIQDFLSMLLLTVAGGLMVNSDTAGSSMTWLILGIILFYLFFAFLAIVVIPRVVKYFKMIKSDELFLLFALGMVFLASAMADFFSVPEIIGAFFVGMIFAETELSEKLSSVLVHLRDAFVAVFFLAFGMMIDPFAFMDVLPILLMAVPVVLINDILFTSALAFLLGFSKTQSSNMATAICGRGAESVLYAKVGTDAITANAQFSNAYGGKFLNPFAGVFCFVMSIIAPPIIRRSKWVGDLMSKMVPGTLKWSAKAVQRVIKVMVMPQAMPMVREERTMLYTLLGLLLHCGAIILTPGWWKLIPIVFIPLTTILLWKKLGKYVNDSLRYVNTGSLGIRLSDKGDLAFFVTQFVTTFFALFLVLFSFWAISWVLVPVVPLAWIVFQTLLLKALHIKIGPEAPVEVESTEMEDDGEGEAPIEFGSVKSGWKKEEKSDTARKSSKSGPKPFEY